MQQTDGIAYKLKLRSFYKFIHLWVNLVDFHSQCEPCLTVDESSKVDKVNFAGFVEDYRTL